MRGVQNQLMGLEAPSLKNGRAYSIRLFLPENHDIERDQDQLIAAADIPKREAGSEQRPMHALGLIVRGAAPGAGIDANRRSDLGSGDAYASAKFRVQQSSAHLFRHCTSPHAPCRSARLLASGFCRHASVAAIFTRIESRSITTP
jgi:hypothetical protein